MNPINNRFVWNYQKKAFLMNPLIFRNASAFIHKADPGPLHGEIPVFCFHATLPDLFEEQCLHLAENGYQTLTGDEFLKLLKSGNHHIEKKVLLTFDDGLKHLWTIAYPLLRKYGLKAVCFLVPGCISETDTRIRPNLEDYWQGKTSFEEIVSLRGEDAPLATWAEIKRMHDSGIIDFQSHTKHHSLVFTSGKIHDFVNPNFDRGPVQNVHIPVYARNGKDVTSRDALLGMPIYFAEPRMSARSRFFDDEEIRNHCINFVLEAGGDSFFNQRNWRRTLLGVVEDQRRNRTVTERYETPEERDSAIFNDLAESKLLIEEKLVGKKVTHLCYPWFEAEPFAIEASKRAGYRSNYFGHIRGRPTNRPGDDPFRIVRIDDLFVNRLPGSRRKRVIDLLKILYGMRKLPQMLGKQANQL